MVYVTKDHVFVRLHQKDYLSQETIGYSSIWRLFNVRNGRLVFQTNLVGQQISDDLLQEANNYQLACTDFSNLDDPQERLIVMR